MERGRQRCREKNERGKNKTRTLQHPEQKHQDTEAETENTGEQVIISLVERRETFQIS